VIGNDQPLKSVEVTAARTHGSDLGVAEADELGGRHPAVLHTSEAGP